MVSDHMPDPHPSSPACPRQAGVPLACPKGSVRRPSAVYCFTYAPPGRYFLALEKMLDELLFLCLDVYVRFQSCEVDKRRLLQNAL